MSQRHDVIRSGAELTTMAGDWIRDADCDEGLIVMLHGLGSHTSHLRPLADHLTNCGLTVALFNYPSHRGMDRAAQALAERLKNLRSSLEDKICVLVGHSMGGLVARLAARRLAVWGTPPAAVVQLGSPNAGTLTSSIMADLLYNALSVKNRFLSPYAGNLTCAAVEQLRQKDESAVIDSLNTEDRESPLDIVYYSVSGGLNFLELGNSGSGVFSSLLNKALQAAIADLPNDGLVAESSADLSRFIHSAIHTNDYAEWDEINHSHLPTSQGVANQVLEFVSALDSGGEEAVVG